MTVEAQEYHLFLMYVFDSADEFADAPLAAGERKAAAPRAESRRPLR
jgi:hypothetical protein